MTELLASLTDLSESLLGIVLNCGSGPHGSYIGGKYWHSPGAFNNGFKGLCTVFVNAVFAFSGAELIGLAAAETVDCRRTIPRAMKQVFWRICIFYIVSLTLVGLLVPYSDGRLGNGNKSFNAHTSPFVIAINNAGIIGLPSAMNAVILISALSVGNSSVYSSSRTLSALSNQGQAPKIFSYIDRQGRPLVSIILSGACGLLCFLAASEKRQEVFNWLRAIAGLSTIFTWGSICLSHIRFRRAWRLEGHRLTELAFTSRLGVFGSWTGFIISCLVLVAQFWIGFAPIGYGEMTAKELVNSWFQAYLAVPVVLAFYISYKIYFRTSFIRTKHIDLVTGRRDYHIERLIDKEWEEHQDGIPLWKKLYKIFC